MINKYLVLIIIVALIIIFGFIDNLVKEPEIFPYQKRKYFLTPTEKMFFEVLLQIINNQYFIFPQIPMSSVIEVASGYHWRTYFNKIIRKSFDFVIFDKQNLNVLLVIELDDRSHERPDRIKRDRFVNESLKVVGLEILHIKPQQNYNTQELSQQIFTKLAPKPNI